MKRSIFGMILAWGVTACVDTTLDTPKNHPANPSLYPAPPAQPPPALSSGFDPFVAYATEVEPAGAPSEHDHARADQLSTAPATSSDAPNAAEPKAQAPAPADDVVVYTCPMHPEIIRNAPGNCPICGMKLVPKKSPKPSSP